jgi:hypothetical protein
MLIVPVKVSPTLTTGKKDEACADVIPMVLANAAANVIRLLPTGISDKAVCSSFETLGPDVSRPY